MKRKITIALALLIFISVNKVFCQEWVVPQDQINIKNPSAYNRQNVKEGKALFMTNCKSCHGEPGKFNAVPLTPPPPDITSEKMILNSEGSLYYKITSGRVAMPSFEKTLNIDQRWKIINFLKSYDPVNAGILKDEEPLKAKLQASVEEATSIISVSAQVESQSGTYGPLQGATVFVKVKKQFGSVEVGKMVTNQLGFAEFTFPKSYKGDSEGKLNLELLLSEDYKCNPVVINQTKICTPHIPENLFKERVLWSTNDRIQIWFLLSYIGVVGGVWAAIGYIIYLLVRIKISGKKVE